MEIRPEDQEPLYEIESVLKHRAGKDETEYLVHWEGYQHEEDT